MPTIATRANSLLDLSDLDLDEVRVAGTGNGAVLEELPPGTDVQLSATVEGVRSSGGCCNCGCTCNVNPARPH